MSLTIILFSIQNIIYYIYFFLINWLRRTGGAWLSAKPNVRYQTERRPNYTLLLVFQIGIVATNFHGVARSLFCRKCVFRGIWTWCTKVVLIFLNTPYSYLWSTDVLLNVHSYSLLVYEPLVIRSNVVLIFIATNHTVTGTHVTCMFVGALRIVQRQFRASQVVQHHYSSCTSFCFKSFIYQ
jgi:hypothetical protein